MCDWAGGAIHLLRVQRSPGELQRTAGRIDLASRSAWAAGTNQATANKIRGLYGGYSALPHRRKTTGDIICFPNARRRAK